MPLFSGGGVEEARGSRDALVRAAIKTYNKRAGRLQDEREEARKQIDIMRAQAQMEKAEAKRKQDDSAMWKGVFSGAATGATVGGAISPGWGHLIGGVAGAVGGGIWGEMDPDSFYETMPIVAQAGQVAAQIGGEFRQKEYMDDRLKMMDKWMSQGSGSAGVGAVSPTATGGEGTFQLREPFSSESKYTTPESSLLVYCLELIFIREWSFPNMLFGTRLRDDLINKFCCSSGKGRGWGIEHIHEAKGCSPMPRHPGPKIIWPKSPLVGNVLVSSKAISERFTNLRVVGYLCGISGKEFVKIFFWYPVASQVHAFVLFPSFLPIQTTSYFVSLPRVVDDIFGG